MGVLMMGKVRFTQMIVVTAIIAEMITRQMFVIAGVNHLTLVEFAAVGVMIFATADVEFSLMHAVVAMVAKLVIAVAIKSSMLAGVVMIVPLVIAVATILILMPVEVVMVVPLVIAVATKSICKIAVAMLAATTTAVAVEDVM